MIDAGHKAKLDYYDQHSSTMEIVNLLQHQPEVFGSFSQFIADCESGELSVYSFIEPSYNGHPGPGGGQILASDQHPTHTCMRESVSSVWCTTPFAAMTLSGPALLS
jgi:hypothetical protein